MNPQEKPQENKNALHVDYLLKHHGEDGFWKVIELAKGFRDDRIDLDGVIREKLRRDTAWSKKVQ